MNDAPLVTIAIPTYNRAGSYLSETLASALAQDYAPLEILVSDNASTDGTEELVRRSMDRRLRYVRHGVNIGSTANYNFCLASARGDYFLLLHDDDAIDRDFVAVCMAAAGYRRDAALIRTGIRLIERNGKVLRECANPVSGLSTADFFCAWFEGKTYWYCANTLFHAALLRAAGGFSSPHRLSEDGFAIARLAHGKRIDVADVKASFRIHGGEQTFAAPQRAAQWGREYRELLDCMCAALPRDEVEKVRRAGLRFFAQRCYDRASHAPDMIDRISNYAEVFRLFGCRYLPAPPRFWRRTTGYLRRRILQQQRLASGE